MRIVLLAAALLATSSLSAQRFSAGARSGLGFWKGEVRNLWTWEYDTKRQVLWEKEVFVRYETAKHLAFELGVNHVETQYKGEVFGLCGTGLPDYYSYASDRIIKDQYVGLNLRAQYGFSCPCVPRLRNYPGISITPTLHVMEDKTFFENVSPSGTSDGGSAKVTTNNLWMQIGFEDVIRYQISRHINVHSLIGYKYIVGGNVLQRAFTLQTGLSYCF